MTRDEGKAEAFPFGPRQLNDVLPCGLADGEVGEAILGDEAGDEGVPGNLEQPSIGYRERGLLSLFYGRITSKGGQCVKGPDKRKIHPNPDVPSLCFIRNLVRNPQILIGDYTYYDDPKTNGEDFERHVEHLYPFLGDRLIIGKFCAIAKGVRFLMNGANHRMNGITTYPFNILVGGWEKVTPRLEDLPLKGDTVIGNDVWIGQDVTFLPGVHVGDGAIIGAHSVVASDIPPYAVAVGNPCHVVRMRFSEEDVEFLLQLRWWDWDDEQIFENLEALTGGDFARLRKRS